MNNKTNNKRTTNEHKQEEKEEKKNKRESIKEKNKFSPPTLEDVKSYFLENGYTENSAQKAFDYYSTAGWRDSRGNQVKNWKQKMIAVWFKDENRRINGNDSISNTLTPEQIRIKYGMDA